MSREQSKMAINNGVEEGLLKKQSLYVVDPLCRKEHIYRYRYHKIYS